METKLKIEGKEYTVEEAKKLYEALREIFLEKDKVVYSPYPVYINAPYIEYPKWGMGTPYCQEQYNIYS